jgi:hypothetical protein
MLLEILVVFLALTALVLGVAILLRTQESPEREVIVRREEVPMLPPGGWPLGPYYSHVPVRPILYDVRTAL